MKRWVAAVAAGAALVLGGCLGIGDPTPRALPADLPEPAFMLASDEAQGPLLIGDSTGLRVSRDGGRTWTTPEGGNEGAIAATATATRVLVSRGELAQPYRNDLTGPEDGPIAWPFAEAVQVIAGSPRRPRLWAITREPRQELRYSNDGGLNWWLPPALGLCRDVRAMAVAPPVVGETERLFVACGEDGLLASDDLGVTFVRVPGIDRADAVAAARADVPRVVVATPQVAVSTDGGATWTYDAFLARLVAVDPRNDGLVFAIDIGGQLFASLDGGATFTLGD
jgi:hypothetical protein